MDMHALRVAHLFRPLEMKLQELLLSLQPKEWEAQTIASQWKVKDVAAHLLDGNIRVLSIQRDRYFGNTPPQFNSYEELVQWLNDLNREWVIASKRISPSVMILLHQATGSLVCDYYNALNPSDKAIFPVAWAGEEESLNWMHLAREYTEKWLHQQQIRDAVNKPGIMTPEFFQPFIRTFAFALPHTYRNTTAQDGTRVRLSVLTDPAGSFDIIRKSGKWQMAEVEGMAQAELEIDPQIAWKLFSKSQKPQETAHLVTFKGNSELAAVALQMVSVMA
jgi:hypothetical protein